VIAALGLLLLPVACRLGQAGIQRNILHPPHIDLSIGGVRLIARTIDYSPMCDAPPDVCDPIRARGVRLYFGWVDVRLPGASSARHYPLISIPLDERDVRSPSVFNPLWVISPGRAK
jgi:hypothetical protein